MLQQDSPRGNSDYEEYLEYQEFQDSQPLSDSGAIGFDVQAELNRLEELVLDNPRIPFTRKTIVDEEQLLDQLDLVRINLPDAFEEAMEIIRQKEEILLQAEEYARDILELAREEANRLLDEMGLIRQAEQEAEKIRKAVQKECEDLQQETLLEIEQTRTQAMQELEEMRRLVLAECDEIQDGADDYADAVLGQIEGQLTDMLRVIRNGRKQLGQEPIKQSFTEEESA